MNNRKQHSVCVSEAYNIFKCTDYKNTLNGSSRHFQQKSTFLTNSNAMRKKSQSEWVIRQINIPKISYKANFTIDKGKKFLLNSLW